MFMEAPLISAPPVKRHQVTVNLKENAVVDSIMLENYWMPRLRRSRRLSYSVCLDQKEVGWVQCADIFGTLLCKPLQMFCVEESVEFCRGYFIESAPPNIESCAIGMMLRRIPNDWYDKFKVTKKLAVIYQDLDVGQKGVVYRALGFKPYAHCIRARNYSLPTRGNSTGKKIVWARGLRRVSGKHYCISLPNPPDQLNRSIKINYGGYDR